MALPVLRPDVRLAQPAALLPGVGLDAFFAGAVPELREVFDRFVAAARESGPVTLNATKSRVSLQVRFRLAAVERPRTAHLAARFVLTRPLDRLAGRGYGVGEQRHLTDSDWPTVRVGYATGEPTTGPIVSPASRTTSRS